MSPRINPKFWQDLGFCFSVVLFIWIVLVIALSFDFPFRARLFPLIIGILALPLIIVTILGKIFVGVADKIKTVRGSTLFDTSAAQKLMKTAETEKTEISYSTLLKIALWFLGAFVLYFFLGYLPATSIFLFSFLKFDARYSWKTCTAITGASAIVAWAIFTAFLNLPPIQWFFS